MSFFNHLLQSKRRVKMQWISRRTPHLYCWDWEQNRGSCLYSKQDEVSWLEMAPGLGAMPETIAACWKSSLFCFCYLLMFHFSFMLYPQKSSIQFFRGMGQYLSFCCCTQIGHVWAGSSSAVGLKEALRMSQLLSHSHRLSTFLCVVLSDQLSVHCP